MDNNSVRILEPVNGKFRIRTMWLRPVSNNGLSTTFGQIKEEVFSSYELALETCELYPGPYSDNTQEEKNVLIWPQWTDRC
jgi:hypothetical protein